MLFVSTLERGKVRASKESLVDKYTIFGRTKHIRTKSETFKLLSLIPEGMKLSKEQIRELLVGFKDIPPIIGTPTRMHDFRICCPAIMFPTDAIYR